MQNRDLPIKCLLIFFCFVSCLVCGHGFAEEAATPLYEQKIKAGLVYNLIKYTEWPKTTATPANQVKAGGNGNSLKICIFGDDPFDGYLSPLQGRTAQHAVISIAHVSIIPQTESCSVIIVHRNQREHLQRLFKFLQGKNILTISDIEKFSELGGMVELARHEEKIALHINKESVDSAKLIIDARMLKLAKIVSSKGGGQ